tara:strand:+ start:526 stop:708 length:183 start_codon:yes stop_codon:yes gene_type:complete
MKKRDVNKLSEDELKKQINLIKKDLFNIRFKKINSQLEDTSKISQLKRDLAKVKTKLNSK